MEFLLPTPTLARGPAVEERGVGLRETYQRPEACSLQPPGLWEGAGPVQSPPAVPAAQRVHWLGLPSNVPPGGVTQCGALDCFCSAHKFCVHKVPVFYNDILLFSPIRTTQQILTQGTLLS